MDQSNLINNGTCKYSANCFSGDECGLEGRKVVLLVFQNPHQRRYLVLRGAPEGVEGFSQINRKDGGRSVTLTSFPAWIFISRLFMFSELVKDHLCV